MKCFQCHRAGYNFQKINNQPWCGACDTPGARTIYQTEGRSGFSPYGLGGLGTVEALPKLCTIQEWREIAKLCRRVSNDKLLFEEGFKAPPLPKCPNPLEDRPGKGNWTPLENYFKDRIRDHRSAK